MTQTLACISGDEGIKIIPGTWEKVPFIYLVTLFSLPLMNLRLILPQ